jgi:hypothetical protein
MDAPAKPWQQCAMPEAKKGRGCFFYGCITLMVLAIIAVVTVLLGVRYGVKYLRSNFTSTKPVAVAPVSLSPTQGERVTQRVEDFKKALRAGTATNALELTGDELDYVVRTSSTNGLQDNIHLTITNNQIHAEMSLPLDMYGPNFFGRFFNGEAKIGLTQQNGTVNVQLVDPRVNGQPIPGWLRSKIPQNIPWVDSDGGTMTNLSKIEIADDKLVLHPKAQ